MNNDSEKIYKLKSAADFPEAIQVIFVQDAFVEENFQGGAELSTEALIQTSPFAVHKLRSSEVTAELIEQHGNRFWVFGNFYDIPIPLLGQISEQLCYTVIEYDYKICRYRSQELHATIEGRQCSCAKTPRGVVVANFLCSAVGVWWMSKAQRDRHLNLVPQLSEQRNVVLSSIFDFKTLNQIRELRQNYLDFPKTEWSITGSPSIIKGADNARRFCEQENYPYRTLWNLSYTKLLKQLATSRGLIYLPVGADTCPRLAIEAKLLGCELILNDLVQHAREEWFNSEDLEYVEQYLATAPTHFWMMTTQDIITSLPNLGRTLTALSKAYSRSRPLFMQREEINTRPIRRRENSPEVVEALKKLLIAENSLTMDLEEIKASNNILLKLHAAAALLHQGEIIKAKELLDRARQLTPDNDQIGELLYSLELLTKSAPGSNATPI